MPKQSPPNQKISPEDKFKQMKQAQTTVSMDAEPKKKPLVTKKASSKDDNAPYTDGKEALISQKITQNIRVDIRNRKEQFFDGDAKTVSSVNDTGEFDVLPKHANFVTLIRGYVIIDKGLPSEKKFEVDNGVLAAKTGAVDVYLDF